MRSYVRFLFLPVLCLLLSFSFNRDATDNKKYISIQRHVDEGRLKAQITGLGGYQKDCIEFLLENNTPDSLWIQLEPGRRLVSEDTLIQDILIVKEENILLAAHEKKHLKGYGFCCQSSKRSPGNGSKFNTGYMAPAGWIELAKVINANKFPASSVQHAIWVLSNNHPISSIHATNMENIKVLRETVAGIKGIELPWYTLTFVKDTAQLFSGRPEMLFGKIDYYIRNNTVVTINIRDKRGRIVKSLTKGKTANPGKYTYDLKLNVKAWPKGEYNLYIYEDFSNLNKRKKFVL